MTLEGSMSLFNPNLIGRYDRDRSTSGVSIGRATWIAKFGVIGNLNTELETAGVLR